MIRRALALALVFAFTAAPLAASAQEKAEAKKPRVEKIDKKKHGKGEFPIEAAKFDEILEKRIEAARAQMEVVLATQPLSDDLKAQIRKDFEKGAAELRKAAKSAEKDGKVTKTEAKDVRDLAKELKQEMVQKYKSEKKDGRDAPRK